MQSVYTVSVSREEFPSFVGSAAQHHRFAPSSLEDLKNSRIGSKEVIIGFWGEAKGNPFPDFIVVNDEDAGDTYAWLSAYLSGFSPVTQWCRIWTRSGIGELSEGGAPLARSRSLGPWIGLVLAESGMQFPSTAALKELSGNAVLSGASFAAARSLAVWSTRLELESLARRYDDLSARARSAPRPIPAVGLLPIWFTLAGDEQNARRLVDERSLVPFRRLFRELESVENLAPENVQDIAQELAVHHDLPDLRRCATGPQSKRVEALDRVAASIAAGPRSVAADAILGFGASLVDQGAAVLPELLRRYLSRFPTAAAWAGAFAGAWSPARVMTDYSGLGRIVAKEILRTSDLFAKPSADIAFEELSRWLGASHGGQLSIRGLAARTLNVEIVPGVTLPIYLPRPEQSKVDTASTSRQRALFDLEAEGHQATGSRRQSDSVQDQGEISMQGLAARIDTLEARFEDFLKRDARKAGSKPGGRSSSGR